MIKAVLFDFGGVLTERCWDLDVMARIIRETFVGEGIVLPGDFHVKFKEVMLEAWNRVLRTRREERIHEHIEETLRRLGWKTNTRVRSLIEKAVDKIKDAPFCVIRPESKIVLEKLSSMGIKLAIVSNSPIRFHDRILSKHGLLDYFECIVVSCEVGYRKPDPRIYEFALKCLNVSPREAVYIGDVPPIDVPGAKKLGIITIMMREPEPAIKSVKIPVEEDSEPDYSIEKLNEVIDIILELTDGGVYGG